MTRDICEKFELLNAFKIRIIEPISLIVLHESEIGKREMAGNCYSDQPWAKTCVPPGIYSIRLPVPYSQNKSFYEQQDLLLPGEQPVPVALAVCAYLAYNMEHSSKGWGCDILRGGGMRCEASAPDYNVLLFRTSEGLTVSTTWKKHRHPTLRIGAASKIDSAT